MAQPELEQYHPWLDDGGVNGVFWKDEENQKKGLKWIIEKTKRIPGKKDYHSNGLGRLIDAEFNQSPLQAALSLSKSDWENLEKAIGQENVYTRLRTEPWTLLKSTPNGYWKNEGNQRRAIKGLIQKETRLTEYEDYSKNGLRYLISKFDNSPYSALLFLNESDWEELEPVINQENVYVRLREEPWTLGIQIKKENRKKVLKWLIQKTQKIPNNPDYSEYGLGNFLDNHFSGRPYKAALYLSESDWQELEQVIGEGSVYNRLRTEPWTLIEVMSTIFLGNKKNQKEALKWLIRKTGRIPIKDEYSENGLRGLIGKFGNSTYKAVLSLSESDWEELEPAIGERNIYNELRINPWRFMVSVPTGYWKDLNNRREAIKWLIKEKGKLPKYKDYLENGLGGLIRNFNSNLYNALELLNESDWHELEKEIPWIKAEYSDYLVERGIEIPAKPIPSDVWEKEGNRREAIKWLIRRRKQLPKYVDYVSNGMGSLIRTFGEDLYDDVSNTNLYNALVSLKGRDWTELEKEIPGITPNLSEYLSGKESNKKLIGPPKRMQKIAGTVLEFLEKRNIRTVMDLRRHLRERYLVGESGESIYLDSIPSPHGTLSRIAYQTKKGFRVFEANITYRRYAEVTVAGHFQIKQYRHSPNYGGKNTRKVDPTIFRLKLELAQLKNPEMYTMPIIPKK